jgi:hypothetical protein
LTKTFQIGEGVLHKQLQVATGINMGMKPKFTGPYVIIALDKHESSATIENLSNRRTMQAHFINLQLFSYHPNFNYLMILKNKSSSKCPSKILRQNTTLKNQKTTIFKRKKKKMKAIKKVKKKKAKITRKTKEVKEKDIRRQI